MRRVIFLGCPNCGQELLPDWNQTVFSLPEQTEMLRHWLLEPQKNRYNNSVAVVACTEPVEGGLRVLLTEEDLVVHLQSSYLEHADAKMRSRIDSSLRRWSNDHVHYLLTEPLSFFSILKKVTNWLGIRSLDQEEKAPHLLYTPEPSSQRLLEDRRLLMNAAPFLTTMAMQKCDLRAFPKPPCRLETVTMPDHGTPIFLVEGLLPEEQMVAMLGPTPVGINPRTVTVLFEGFDTIRPLLAAPQFYQHLVSGRLKLWHSEEYEERLRETLSRNPRSCVARCKTVYGNPEKVEIISRILRDYQTRYIEIIEKSRALATAYYQSEEFQKRRLQVAKGAPPRILVEQGCHTVATKQFSRNAAKALKNLPCELYIHPNCGPDAIDYVIANIIEIARFKPDLIIRAPNQFGTPEDNQQKKSWSSLPILTVLQDLDPHLVFPHYLKINPPRYADLVMLLQHRFRQPLLEKGLTDSQILCEYIPCDQTQPIIIKGQQNDVGFVKTLSPSQLLKERVEFDLTPAQIVQLDQLNTIVRKSIKEGPHLDVHELQKLGKQLGVSSDLCIIYHEELCIHFAKALYAEGYTPQLYGQNWDRISLFTECARGHIDSRERYMAQFLEHKINLSINPWNEFHSRIFDGGSLGAFFLVYRVDPSVRWQPLPSELKDGEHFVYFANQAELVEKCRYYLNHPEERQRIGSNLQKVVLENYTYKAAMERLIHRLRAIFRSEKKQQIESPVE